MDSLSLMAFLLVKDNITDKHETGNNICYYIFYWLLHARHFVYIIYAYIMRCIYIGLC